MFPPFAQSSGALSVSLAFTNTLQSSLVPSFSQGSLTPTSTRATTATQLQHDGNQVQVLAEEARFTGARRIQNFCTYSEDFSNAVWGTGIGGTGVTATKTPNYGIAPDGTTTATRLILDKGAGATDGDQALLTHTTVTFDQGSQQKLHSLFVRSTDGASSYTIIIGDAGNTASCELVPVTSTWQRVAMSAPTVLDGAKIRIAAGLIGSPLTSQTADILIWHPMSENVTGQSNQNPGEYVSSNVLSAPWHGANVDAVKYFTTLNGNTVSSNVVTEATGAPITNANSSYADAKGPFGYLAEGQRTNNALWNRDFTNAVWVKVTTTAAKDQIGVDGTANSASSLLATGANATTLQTYVAASTTRTFGLLIKRITGTGTISVTSDGVNYTATTINASTWTLCADTHALLNPAFGVKIATSGDKIAVDMAMLEDASFTSSPIPGTTVAVTRNADVDQYISAGNLNTNDITIYGESQFPVVPNAANYYLFGTYVDANNGTAVLWDGSNLIARRRIGGVSNDATIAFTPTAGTIFKWAARCSSTSGTDIFLNGTAGTNNAVTTACQIGTNFQIGADGNSANQPFATVRLVNIARVSLSNAAISAL